MRSKFLIVLLFGSVTFFSCRKEDPLVVDDIPGLGGDTWTKTSLDKWLYDTLTVPFNIATKYKWDQFELDVNKNIVPPKEENAKMMNPAKSTTEVYMMLFPVSMMLSLTAMGIKKLLDKIS